MKNYAKEISEIKDQIDKLKINLADLDMELKIAQLIGLPDIDDIIHCKKTSQRIINSLMKKIENLKAEEYQENEKRFRKGTILRL